MGPPFDHVIVLGNSELSYNHVRAWSMIGIGAKRSSSSVKKKAFTSKNDGNTSSLAVDVCETDYAKRARIFKEALRENVSVLTMEPVLKTFDSTKKILEQFQTRKKGDGNKPSFTIIDPIAHHPLIVLSKKEISGGRIGTPRILRLEVLLRDKALSDYSLSQSLIHALRTSELLFEPRKLTRVFAKKVKTRTSKYFVILANLEEGCTAHIVAGNSAAQGKFEFAINGTGGMLSFNESKTLDLPRGAEYSNALKASESVEVLASAFSAIATNPDPSSLSQRLGQAVLESVRSSKPVPISR